MRDLKVVVLVLVSFIILTGSGQRIEIEKSFVNSQTFGLSNSTGLACGDLDGDGVLDVVVTNEGQPDQVWLANATGALKAKDQNMLQNGVQGIGNSTGRAIDLADFDGDGDLDVVVANYKQQNSLWWNDGTGLFVAESDTLFNGTTWNSQYVVTADVNTDEWPDIIFCNGKDQDEIWRNTGSGNFILHQALTAGSSRGAAVGDLNGDSRLDLVITHYFTENVVWLQQSNGTFAIASGFGGAYNASSSNAVLGDIDGDEDLDIVVCNYFNQANRVYINDGLGNDGQLVLTEKDQNSKQKGMQGFGQSRSRDARLIDVDEDGDLDCLVVNSADGIEGSNKLWMNNGNGVFVDSGLRIGESQSYGLAAGDMDQDDAEDIIVANFGGQANTIWLSDEALFDMQAGWIEGQATAKATQAIALADFDGDGSTDVFLANAGLNQVWHNRGNGTFVLEQTLAANANSTDIALADIDQNGSIDAVVCNGDVPSRVLSNTDGTFVSIQTISAAKGAALTDLNGDTYPDLFLARGKNQGNEVWLNQQGVFVNANQSLGGANSTAVALGDLNGDGVVDACVSNSGTNSSIWVNDGNGSFSFYSALSETANSTGVALADIDHDQDLDIVLCNYAQQSTVWKNTNGTFTVHEYLASSNSTSVILEDVDKDGFADILISRTNGQGVGLWKNNGKGVFFYSAQQLGLSSNSHDLGGRDLDGDGDIDVFIGNASPNAVWLNTTAKQSGGGGGCS